MEISYDRNAGIIFNLKDFFYLNVLTYIRFKEPFVLKKYFLVKFISSFEKGCYLYAESTWGFSKVSAKT